MYCDYCGHDAPREEWEAKANELMLRLTAAGVSYDEYCPKCEEPYLSRDYHDDYYEPEPEPSELDKFVTEVFQPGDEETLADHAQDA